MKGINGKDDHQSIVKANNMYEHFKTNVPYDYFVKNNGEYYYINFNYALFSKCDEICFNTFEKIPNDCLPKIMIPIKLEDIQNAKPEYDELSIDDVCCFYGGTILRNRISILEYSFTTGGLCLDEKGELIPNYRDTEVFLHRCGKAAIITKDHTGKKEYYIKHLKYDEVIDLFNQMEYIETHTGSFGQIVDDQCGHLTLYYENQKQILLPRGIEDLNKNSIHHLVTIFLETHNIQPWN